MSVHVAILLRRYIQLILAGRKTVESRLTRTPRPPYRAIRPGDRVYFKASSGPYMATAIVGGVEFHQNLTPNQVSALRKRLNHAVCGDAQFWQWKRDSRYATFVTLRDAQPTDVGPKMSPSSGIAWFVFDDEADPMLDLNLTDGAIRNRYVYVPKKVAFFPAGRFGLLLPDGRLVETDLNTHRCVRWRGWGQYYREHRLVPGDAVRFVQLGRRRYRVTFLQQDGR